MEWQPISECPPDTAVLLWSNGYVVGHFNTGHRRWCSYTDGTGTAAEVQMNREGMGPSHWMPLPAPPTNE